MEQDLDNMYNTTGIKHSDILNIMKSVKFKTNLIENKITKIQIKKQKQGIYIFDILKDLLNHSITSENKINTFLKKDSPNLAIKNYWKTIFDQIKKEENKYNLPKIIYCFLKFSAKELLSKIKIFAQENRLEYYKLANDVIIIKKF